MKVLLEKLVKLGLQDCRSVEASMLGMQRIGLNGVLRRCVLAEMVLRCVRE